MLAQTGFRDAFRHLYPDARGQFSYWSQRTFARPVNRGLRLDYFVCSRSMFPKAEAESGAVNSLGTQDGEEEVAAAAPVEERVLPAPTIDFSALPSPGVSDSYSLYADTIGCSDHCPVVLVVKL
jgi:exonuclease III